MNILTSDTGKLFRKYLLTSLGSALIVSIYSIVDMICVGQYQGDTGSAALSIITPTWSVFISLGLMIGIGGGVLFGISRGAGDEKKAQQFFSASIITAILFAAVSTVLFFVFEENIIRFFGANDNLLPYCTEYLSWILPALPTYIFSQTMAGFIRNDNDPARATLAVVAGGCFNVFGDIFFVFGLNMGIYGAGMATGIGSFITLFIMLTHFFSKKNTLKLSWCHRYGAHLKQIISTGFAPFIIDVSFGIIVIIFNNQIMSYAGETELAVFGCVANISILVLAVFYGAGQALQPLASANYGAMQYDRVRKFLKLAIWAAVIIGVCLFTAVMIFPEQIISAMIDASDSVLAIGPAILRTYATAYLFMGVNVVLCYYFQSVVITRYSIIISLLRGFIICIALLYLLPAAFGFSAIWFTVPATEAATLIIAIQLLRKSRKHLQLK